MHKAIRRNKFEATLVLINTEKIVKAKVPFPEWSISKGPKYTALEYANQKLNTTADNQVS